MGRSKAAPKRRRVELEQDEKRAVEILLHTSTDEVEAAAAAATRSYSRTWPRLLVPPTKKNTNTNCGIANAVIDDNVKSDTAVTTSIPAWCRGLGASQTLPVHHFEALRTLHERIKERVSSCCDSRMASWSGSVDDPRQRAFGFLPGTLGQTIHNNSDSGDNETPPVLDISMPWVPTETGTEQERKRNYRAMAHLTEKDLPAGAKEAIQYLCRLFIECSDEDNNNKGESNKDAVSAAQPRLRDYLSYPHLVAAQPNLHNGRELLPTHVDHPLKDGFGVAIVTVGIVGSGTLLLEEAAKTAATSTTMSSSSSSLLSAAPPPSSDGHRLTMDVHEGQAYMLFGRARDACAHGILANSQPTSTLKASKTTTSADAVVGNNDNSNRNTGTFDADTTVANSTRDDKHAFRRESLNLRFGLHDYHQGSFPVVSSHNVLQYWEE